MASSAAALLTVAAQQIGTMEGRDPSGNWNNLQKFGAWYGMNGVPWCDIFVSWCASMSGSGDIIPKSAYVPGRLAWARSKGLSGHYPPAPGDLGIVNEPVYGGNGQVVDRYVHIFIVEKYLGNGRVQTIEGNTNNGGSAQGNGVYRLIRQDSPTSSRYIYIRPQYVAALPPIGAGGASAPPPVAGFNYADVSMDMSKGIDASALRPGQTNAHVARLESAIWNWRGIAFRKALVSRYKLTSRGQLYNPTYTAMLAGMVGDSYRLLHTLEPKNGWLTDRQARGVDPLPTWPGPVFLKRIGFKSVR